MRIRHPHSVPSARSADGIELPIAASRDKSINGTSSYPCSSPSPVIQDVSNSEKQSPPPLAYKGEYFSPTHFDPNEDSNTTYLKPDFLEPVTVAKSEPVCPSPLALLAKTCQSIGQMMEAGFATIPPVSVTQRSNSACSGSNNQISPTIGAPKHNKSSKSCSPTESRMLVNGKRPVSGRAKWVKSEAVQVASNSMNGSSPPTHRSDSVSSTHQTGPSRMPINGSTEQAPISQRSLHPNSTKLADLASPSMSTNHSTLNKPYPSDFTRTCSPVIDIQTTSNALAQLARLSSSLSLPESPRIQPGGVLDSTQTKSRFHWTEPLRVQTGAKRSRRYSGPKSCTNPSAASSANMTSVPRKMARETIYHPQTYTESGTGMNFSHLINSPVSPNNSQHALSPQSTANSRCSNNYPSLTTSWLVFTQFMQQLMEQKDHVTHVNNAPSPETFYYSLARSFMDLFYTRMMSTQSSVSNTSLGYSPLKESSPVPQMSLFDNPARIPPTPTGTAIKPSSIETDRSNSSETLSSRCFLCGHQCSSQTELCLHVYSHLLLSEKEQISKSENKPELQNGSSVEFLNQKQSAYAACPTNSSPEGNLYGTNHNLFRSIQRNSLPVPSYLSEWISKHRDFDFLYNSTETVNSSHIPGETSRGLPASKPASVENGLHAYWMKLLTTYTQTSPNMDYSDPVVQRLVDTGVPAPNPTLNSNPNISTLPSATTTGHSFWNPLMFPFFALNNSPLTLYPKV